jgi:hypothetical protein
MITFGPLNRLNSRPETHQQALEALIVGDLAGQLALVTTDDGRPLVTIDELAGDSQEAAAIAVYAGLRARERERPAPPKHLGSRPLTLRDRAERWLRGHFEEW